jgi:hypothetical protein
MARAPAGSKFTALVERLASAPAVISGAVVLFSLLSASIFLFAYVRVFDWRLIWLVDYADVLRIGLVAIAFFSGIAWYVWAVFDDAYNWASPRNGAAWRRYLVRALWLGSMAYWLYVEYTSGEARYTLVAFVFLSILLVFVIAWRAVKLGESSRLNVRDAMILAFLLIIAVGLFGTAFGYYSRDAWRSIEQRVVLDEVELRGARLIILTSRHAAFFHDGNTIIVPAMAVKRMESRKR